MEQCPLCKSNLKTIPAGTSKKSGKPYNSFTACENRECSYTKNSNAPVKNDTHLLNDINLKLGKMSIMLEEVYNATTGKKSEDGRTEEHISHEISAEDLPFNS